MQIVARADPPQRVLYYAAKLYSSQQEEGKPFDCLRPAYPISIVDSVVIPDVPAFHTRYVLRDAANDLTFTDDFVLYMIDLPKFQTAVRDLADRLADWCYFLRNADRLDPANLPARLTAPAIRQAMETLRMISQTECERIEYEDRVNYPRRIFGYENETARARKELEERTLRTEQEARRNEEEARRLAEQQAAIADEYAALAERSAAIAAERAEHEAHDRAARIDRITLALRLLNRPAVPHGDLVARPHEDLRRFANLLELEALRGAT